jgi:hypothetical protein
MKSLYILRVKTTFHVENTQLGIGFQLHENTPNVMPKL